MSKKRPLTLTDLTEIMLGAYADGSFRHKLAILDYKLNSLRKSLVHPDVSEKELERVAETIREVQSGLEEMKPFIIASSNFCHYYNAPDELANTVLIERTISSSAASLRVVK